MLIKTDLSDSIIEFLKKDYIVNLNIFGIFENIPDAEIYVDNVDNPTGVLVKKDDYMHYLYCTNDAFIDEIVDAYMKTGFYGFSGVERSIAEKLMKKVNEKHIVCWETPSTVYYMPKENLNTGLIKSPVKPIDIKFAEVVDKFYTYRDDGTLQVIKRDISNRPSSAVYVNDDIACWVLIHDDNSMGIMYTKEEYRRKGYAVDVTIDLAARIIDRGNIPYIQIVEGNNMSPGLAQKCGFIEHSKDTWFGTIIGTPEFLISGNDDSRKQFLNIIGEDLKDIFSIPEDNYLRLCMPMHNFDENYYRDMDFQLADASDKDSIGIWCGIVSDIHGFAPEGRADFTKRINEEMSKEKPLLLPFLGMKNGRPVSVSALIELEREIYGLYLLGAEGNDGSLLELTLNETLMASAKNHSFMIFTQASGDGSDIFRKVGFRAAE